MAKEVVGSGQAVAAVDQDPRWAVVQRVIASAAFARSARLSHFLTYVCERTILGLKDQISEQLVGIYVFDRTPDYNSSEDNIVRTHARLLRKKLEEYYASEGRDETIRIVIPKGGYVPEFRTVDTPHEEPPSAEPVVPTSRRVWMLWVAGALAVLFVAGGLMYRQSVIRRPPQKFTQFWSRVLSDVRPTVIVPSDTSLVLFQNYTGRRITLNEYVTREFWQKFDTPPNIERNAITTLSRLPYTNTVDLNFCWSLARRSAADVSRSSVHPARDLRMADLKGVNAILIGARRANPWVELFDHNNTFQGLFDPSVRDYVSNRDPHEGELRQYHERSEDGITHAYAVVAFIRGLNVDEDALLLSGTNTGGTEGAADFVLNEQAFGAFLQKISSPGAPIPHFEVVLDVENVVGSSPRATVAAYRIQQN